MSGTLYLIPNTLGEGDTDALDAVLPAPVRARAASLHYYIGENAKTTRAFLKKVGTERPIQDIEIRELNVNTPAGEIDKLLAPLLAGTDAGLPHRGAVEGRVGADLDVLLDHHPAHLGNLVVHTARGGIAEAVRAQHGTGVDRFSKEVKDAR